MYRDERKNRVRPKKSLGQHFLHDQHIAQRIVASLQVEDKGHEILEIGPGMGMLTQFLLERPDITLRVIELDRDSVAFLRKKYAGTLTIIEGDFLTMNIKETFSKKFSIIGNFPYNISSQIFFKALTHRDQVHQVVCMLQKEVAERIASPPGSKTYGILSVLLQAYFDIEYLFKVPPGVFTPPPRVMSAVIRLVRNKVTKLPCDDVLFVQVVKQAFNTRRKTLRNALKNLNLPSEISTLEIMNKRAEQLSVESFVHLTQLIEKSRGAAIG
jgi:16S rRNA (adenine1518-N6/adenine1519-N6)-dimethyltransferase